MGRVSEMLISLGGGCYDSLNRFRAKDASYVSRFLAKVSAEFAMQFIIQTIIWNFVDLGQVIQKMEPFSVLNAICDY